MRKILVCCYNDLEFKVYILHFAYAIHRAHHNLVNKCDMKSQNFITRFYSKKHIGYLSLSLKEGHLISYRAIFSHSGLSVKVYVKCLRRTLLCLKNKMQTVNSQLFRIDYLVFTLL
jgi:hypothetical protein